MRWRHSSPELPQGPSVSDPRKCTKNSSNVKISPAADSYQGVTIRPCLGACAAISKQQGRRYLTSEAPQLPLPGCDNGECTCRYQYHQDRRGNEDRRFEFGQFNGLDPRSGKKERRLAGNRERRCRKSPAEPAAYFNNY